MPSLRPVFGSTGAPGSVALGQAFDELGQPDGERCRVAVGPYLGAGGEPGIRAPEPRRRGTLLAAGGGQQEVDVVADPEDVPSGADQALRGAVAGAQPPVGEVAADGRAERELVDGVVDRVAVDRPEDDVRPGGRRRQGGEADEEGAGPLVDEAGGVDEDFLEEQVIRLRGVVLRLERPLHLRRVGGEELHPVDDFEVPFRRYAVPHLDRGEAPGVGHLRLGDDPGRSAVGGGAQDVPGAVGGGLGASRPLRRAPAGMVGRPGNVRDTVLGRQSGKPVVKVFV